ncbi:MAG TPA: ATP-binding protein [Rickettsiales bacterium]|nr:ATP-binding protein [Rickettsiales bacterium]
MLTRKLFNSTILRLTLLYAAFFSISIIFILTFVYFATVREIENQITHRINVQLNQAQSIYHAGGLDALKKATSEFLEEDDDGLSIYLLVDNQGKQLVGNMEAWPQEVEYSDNWMMFYIESQVEAGGIHVLARERTFPGGYRLLVGYSLKGPDRTRKIMFDVVSASIVLAFIITAFGGAMFSGVIRKKLEGVNQICRQVIGGNLDVKVPVTGSGDEFDHLADNVNGMLTRIAELVNGLKQASDNIAHDLRTPLNRHRIRLDGILTHDLPVPKMRENVKAGIEEVDMIVETLNSILRISQAQSGVASGHFVTFDLSLVVENVIDFYGDLAEQKHITLDSTIPPGISATGDKPLITQAIANLIDNAIKYTPKNGKVSVTLRVNEQYVECIVADNGTGIPPHLYDKVKERFFRMEASRTSAGTGLGLSLVDAVAKLHRGELIFEDNAPGLKATFKFMLLSL